MLLSEIVETSARVASTSARLEKIERLSACLARLEPDETEVGVALLSGELRQGRVGIGPAVLREVRSHAPAVEPSLTLGEVDDAFTEIAGAGGPGSTGDRTRRLGVLFSRATSEEREFLARLVLRELRQGALEGLIVDAVARASGIPAARVRRARMLAGDTVVVARAALVDGPEGLDRFALVPFRPVLPMLAYGAEDVSEALGRMDEAAWEHKLDGARIQVHRDGDEVRVYTRKLHDVTAAVPEIVDAVRRLPCREAILDGETLVVGADGRPEPFQTTMRRFGRKLDVDALRGVLPLRAFFFDGLLLDGEALLDRPARERLDALSDVLPPELAIPRIVTGDPDEAARFLASAVEAGHEGVMAKSLDAVYEAGSRGRGWLKIKRVHTLDLVVLAAEWGHGRRRGRLSNLHLGARDPASGGFVMLGKTFKGLTDRMLDWQTRRLQELAVSRDRHVVRVRPELVVEVAFNDVQSSPHYPAGMALRFARVRRYREDKTADEADTVDAVRALHPGEDPKRDPAAG